MINNKLFGQYFQYLRLSKSLTYEQALTEMGLPADDHWISLLENAEENGIIKNRFFKRIKSFYGVTEDYLSTLTRKAFEHKLKYTDNGRIISFMKEIIKNRDLIRANPRYSNITLPGVWLQSPYIGGGPLPLGVLIELWSDIGLTCKCDNCGGDVYIFGALFALSTSKHWGNCIECKNYFVYTSEHPQFKREYSKAWGALARYRKEKTSDETATVKEMLLDILKGREDYEDLVSEYELVWASETTEKIEFTSGGLFFKGHKLSF